MKALPRDEAASSTPKGEPYSFLKFAMSLDQEGPENLDE